MSDLSQQVEDSPSVFPKCMASHFLLSLPAILNFLLFLSFSSFLILPHPPLVPSLSTLILNLFSIPPLTHLTVAELNDALPDDDHHHQTPPYHDGDGDGDVNVKMDSLTSMYYHPHHSFLILHLPYSFIIFFFSSSI